MRTQLTRYFMLIVTILLLTSAISAQDRTLGVIVNESGALDGYTLFSPQRNGLVYLIDNDGRIINEWSLEGAVREAYLLENGNIVVATGLSEEDLDTTYLPESFFNGATGTVVELTWDGEIVWEYSLIDPKLRAHHGVTVMPNGNYLLIVWSYRSIEEAIDMGLNVENYGDHSFILPDGIVEIDYQTKEIVWKWDTWDHLIQNFDPDKSNFGEPSENLHRINVNYQEASIKGDDYVDTEDEDWLHSNAIAYHPELDQISLSARRFDEVWVIDHNTTIEEAAGPAGDLLYRWGNPFAYDRGNLEDRFFYNPHDIQWVEAGKPGEGNIIIFNNRDVDDDGNEFSSIIEFTPDVTDDGTYTVDEATGTFNPQDIEWKYAAQGFYSINISGVYRLMNGNTFIIEGREGRMFEVTPEGEVVWDYRSPVTIDSILDQGTIPEGAETRIFRARKYPSNYAGLEGKDLTPGDYLVE